MIETFPDETATDLAAASPELCEWGTFRGADVHWHHRRIALAFTDCFKPAVHHYETLHHDPEPHRVFVGLCETHTRDLEQYR